MGLPSRDSCRNPKAAEGTSRRCRHSNPDQSRQILTRGLDEAYHVSGKANQGWGGHCNYRRLSNCSCKTKHRRCHVRRSAGALNAKPYADAILILPCNELHHVHRAGHARCKGKRQATLQDVIKGVYRMQHSTTQ